MKTINIVTWLDVEFILESYKGDQGFPEWLVRYTVYQNQLDLEVADGTREDDIDALMQSVFGARFRNRAIWMDSAQDKLRSLPIVVERLDEMNARPRSAAAPLSFRRVAALSKTLEPTSYPSALEGPPIVAFYSFKGGVGRTTHLLSYLQSMSNGKGYRSALVIDADIEAPGITSLLIHEASVPQASLSFIDVLSLIQSDPSSSADEALEVSAFLASRQVLPSNNSTQPKSYYIPSFRSEEQSMRLDIRPEHIANRPEGSWKLTTFLSLLGRKLGVDVVLIDLRAGYSELASPFLFDPRVQKVIVSTPSVQAVDGTVSVLQQLGKLSPSTANSEYPAPSVVISFVLAELIGSDFLTGIIARLEESFPTAVDDPDWPSIDVVTTPFSQELLYFESFSDALSRLAASSLSRQMADLIESELPSIHPSALKTGAVGIDEVRRSLKLEAESLEFAESGKGQGFLRIAPLRALVTQFEKTLPNAVVIGAKGAGKTYTYLQLCRSENWARFVATASGRDERGIDALLWPVLHSRNLDIKAHEQISATQKATALALGDSNSDFVKDVPDMIRETLRLSDADETLWRHRWFQVFAHSLGLPIEPANTVAGKLFEYLKERGKRLVLLIDGLEDMFPNLASNANEQTALRALMQAIPTYLRGIPNSPLGIVVFVRADLARAAVPQNYGQFSRLYDAFALQWNQEEALRLAVWLSDGAGVQRPDGFENKLAEDLSLDEAKEVLLGLWGRKLGTEKSREAKSADWVIAALSDFRAQVQARDLVRFLQFAAAASVGSTFEDRVLAPNAIRNAIKPCSLRKIEEAEQEIPQLKAIFNKLQAVSDLRVPFGATQAKLNTDEMRFLQSVGIVAEVEGEYYMPEIFRLGLGLKSSEGARPKVLSLARRFAL